MNKIFIGLLIVSTNICFAQSEPEQIKAKDLLEKIDRSDLEAADSEIGKIEIPKMEMPKISIDKGKGKGHSKSINKPTKKKVVKSKVARPQNKAATAGKAKTKVVISKRPIGLNQLKDNDKVVRHKGKTYIYRQKRNVITQYLFNGKLALNSKGLTSKDPNSYYITDKAQLLTDSRLSKKTNSKSIVKNKVASTQKPKVVEVASQPETITSTKDTVKNQIKRKEIEEKYNRGDPITKNLKLKNLLIDDEIYVFGDLQLVTRRSRNIAGLRKYWLIEKLDINNVAVKNTARNKYQIVKRYQ